MDASPATPSSEEPSNQPSAAPEAPAASDASPDAPPASDAPRADTPDASRAADATETPRRGPPPGVSWLGLVPGGIGLVLAALGIASLLVSRDNGVKALDARLAGVESNV